MNARITSLVFALTVAAGMSSSLAQEPATTSPQPDAKKPMIPATVPGRDQAPQKVPGNVIPQPQGLVVKPADPAKVRATFDMNGARVDITEGEFFDCQERLKRF